MLKVLLIREDLIGWVYTNFGSCGSLAAMGHVQYVETYVSRRLRVEHAEVV